MAGLEIYKSMLEQTVLPPENRSISEQGIELALGAKPFEISGILRSMHEFVEAMRGRTIAWGECLPPFDKVWLEWEPSEYGPRDVSHEGRTLSCRALVVRRVDQVILRTVIITQAPDRELIMFGPFDEVPDDSDEPQKGFIMSALYLINSTHIETLGRRISPTLERKVRRSTNRLPFLTWSEVKLKPGETVTVPATTTLGTGGWKMPWHEVRGHFHWYRVKHGVQRGECDDSGHWHDKPGFWVRNWLNEYERGDDTVGIKRTRYKVVA